MIENLVAKFDEFTLTFDLGFIPQQAWVEDEEHGLVHGYFVAFFASLHNDRGIDHDVLVRSCLLHDYMRCTHEEPHDQRLKELVTDLDPATYTHTEPPDPTHPLVAADRIELLRYPDWMRWVDLEMLPQRFKMAELLPVFDHRAAFTKRIKEEWKDYVDGQFGS